MGRPLPLWTFWLPIAAQRASDGTGAAYVPTGHGGHTTPPALYLKGTLEEQIAQLFVGKAVYQAGARAAEDYDRWLRSRRSTTDELGNGGESGDAMG